MGWLSCSLQADLRNTFEKKRFNEENNNCRCNNKLETMETDFLVIGSGIAGLTYALKVSEKYPGKKIIVITKVTADETNTKYAQGGVAVVNDLENDSFQKHIEDTLIAGDGLCNKHVVEIVVKEGPERVNEIIAWGANFDKDAEGDFKL